MSMSSRGIVYGLFCPVRNVVLWHGMSMSMKHRRGGLMQPVFCVD